MIIRFIINTNGNYLERCFTDKIKNIGIINCKLKKKKARNVNVFKDTGEQRNLNTKTERSPRRGKNTINLEIRCFGHLCRCEQHIL